MAFSSVRGELGLPRRTCQFAFSLRENCQFGGICRLSLLVEEAERSEGWFGVARRETFSLFSGSATVLSPLLSAGDPLWPEIQAGLIRRDRVRNVLGFPTFSPLLLRRKRLRGDKAKAVASGESERKSGSWGNLIVVERMFGNLPP